MASINPQPQPGPDEPVLPNTPDERDAPIEEPVDPDKPDVVPPIPIPPVQS
jgi:hypothetical protein